MEKFKNIFRKLGPIAASLFLLICVAVSLSGYKMPTFDDLFDFDIPEKQEVQAAQADTESETQTDANELAKLGDFQLEDGVYRGEGTGFSGKIVVDVTIEDKTIKAIEVVSTGDDAAFFNRATALIDQIISDQSLEVDVVSGATYSSKGIIAAVKNALTGETDDSEPVNSSSSKKKPKVTKTKDENYDYKDGTYTGTGTGFAGPITVKVKIKKGKIKTIKLTKYSDGQEYINKAKSVINRIVKKQTTNVDVASGATYSSSGIIEAVRAALKKAKVDKSKDDSDDTEESSQETTESESEESTEQIPTGNFPYNDGTYAGAAEGYRGVVRVNVTIKDKTITQIDITEKYDDDAFFNKASTLTDLIIKKQTTEVDVVSGATYSSKGIIGAVKNALEAADAATNGSSQSTEDNSGNSSSEASNSSESTGITYKDGKYTGSAQVVPDVNYWEAYTVYVTVTIKNNTIESVDSIESDCSDESYDYFTQAVDGNPRSLVTSGMKERVLSLKDLSKAADIDTVSGATCTSKAIREAVQTAVEKAKVQ